MTIVNGKIVTSDRLPLPAILLTALIGGPILWFGWLYPLWPTTPTGWVAGIGSGIAVSLYFAGGALVIGWLERQKRYKLLCRALGALTAVSLGIGIFWLALKGQAFIAANFAYAGH